MSLQVSYAIVTWQDQCETVSSGDSEINPSLRYTHIKVGSPSTAGRIAFVNVRRFPPAHLPLGSPAWTSFCLTNLVPL